MMRVKLSYGKDGLAVDFPEEGVSVIEPHPTAGLPDEQAALREALRSPIGCPALRDLVKPNQTVAITFPDVTRPCPTARMLPSILEELSGVPRERIVLVSGTGMHRPNTEEEMRGLVGDHVYENYRVIDHNAFDPSTLALAGKTKRGTELWVNAEYLKADVKILVGFVEPHMFAGFSGGGKAVLPGIAGEATVLKNHDAEMIGDKKSIWGVTKGNPIWTEMRESALLTKPTFLCNVTLNRDHQITGVYYGEMVAAHDRAIEFARKTAMRPTPEPFDIVVTTNSGYPLDQNLYQTTKGISAATMILKRGGAVVAAAECRDGIPNHGNYRDMLKMRSTPTELLEMIRQPGFHVFDQWAIQLHAMFLLKADVYLYSTIPDDDVLSAHLQPIDDIAATVRDLVGRYGPTATVAVLPQGPFTIPYVADEAGRAYATMAEGGRF